MLWRTQPSRRVRKVDRLCDHTFYPRALNSNSIVVDLGANHGEFSHELIRRYGCQVHAVEPLSHLCTLIQPSPRLQLYRVAIGGNNGTAQLRVFSSRCASLLEAKQGETTLQTEEVKVLDLHSLLMLIKADHIDLMKVDVEGAEVEMFGSALPSDLRHIDQISVEFHDFIYPEQRDKVEHVMRRLRSMGFWVIKFSLDNTDVLFMNPVSGISLFEYRKLKYISKYIEGGKRRLRTFRGRRSRSSPALGRSKI